MRLRRRYVAIAQAALWLPSGLWPIVDLRSFERVTGPKREPWLVKTVGLLIAATGAALAIAAARDRVSRGLALAAGLQEVALAGVDVRYAAARPISPVYLLDAPLELAFAAGLLLAREK